MHVRVCVCVCVCVEKGCVQFTVHNNYKHCVELTILKIIIACTYEVCSVESVSYGGSKSVIVNILCMYVCMYVYLYIPLMTALEYFLLISSPVQTDTDTMMMTSSTTQSKLAITGK